jgi:transcriptional regulator with XRE-family HTH domain
MENTELIKRKIAEKGLTRRAACAACGISGGTLHNVLNGKRVSMRIAAKIAAGLELDLMEVAPYLK